MTLYERADDIRMLSLLENSELVSMQAEDDRGGLLRYINKLERLRKHELSLFNEVKTLISLVNIPNEILLSKFNKVSKRNNEIITSSETPTENDLYCQEINVTNENGNKKKNNNTNNNKKYKTSNDNKKNENLPPNKVKIQAQQQKKEKVVKVIEVVRGKDARKTLRGFDCERCKQFYDSFVKQYGEERAAELKQECSRHRSRFTPPKTPEGYWDLSMQSPWNDDNKQQQQLQETGELGETQESYGF